MRLFVVLIALCVVVQGQEPQSTAPRETDKPTTGSITGKVVNDAGQPVAGAAAFVRPVSSMSMGRTTTTDAEGMFTVNNLEPGLYTVSANAPAYTSTPSDPNDPTTYHRIGDSVNLRLVRGGVITGTVTNSLGDPIVAVRVKATMIRDANGQAPKIPFAGTSQGQTDDRGVYRMYGLLPGTYLVSAGGLGMQQSFNFNPYDFDVPTYAPSSTRDTAAEVAVRSGEESNIDIRYRGEPGYIISGTVKAAPTNVASVAIMPAAGNFQPAGNTFQPPGGRGFAFNGVGDGDYDLIAQEFSATQVTATPTLLLSEPKRVTVKGANVTGIEIVTRPLGSISGRVVVESSKIPECQGKRPPLLAETLVQLRRPEKDVEKEPMIFFRFGNAASPDAKGDFVLRNVAAGRYQFEPRFYARYWYLQSITISAATPATGARPQAASSKTDAAASWTNVKFGEAITNLTITLAEGAASIRGKLASGEAAAGMTFYLVPSEPDKADDVLRFFVTEIGADGTFALNNLPPGKYWALAQTNADAQTATLIKLREPEAATARTKLRKTAETQKTGIELKPCQNLTDYQLK